MTSLLGMALAIRCCGYALAQTPEPVVVPEPATVSAAKTTAGGSSCPCPCENCPSCRCRQGSLCANPSCTCYARMNAAALPPGCRETPTGEIDCGLERGKLKGGPRYILDGEEVSKERARRAVESAPGGQIPDESRMPRLVLIGQESDRKRVLSDLDAHPGLAPWKGTLLVQAYSPDNLVVKRKGYVTSGSPSMTLVAPDGTVLARNLDGAYHGPDNLAQALSEVAVAYDPRKDRDLKPAPPPPPFWVTATDWIKGLPGWAWAVAVLGAYLLYQQRKTKE